MVDPAEISRGWLVEEPFGPHIRWIALAEKSWPRVKPTYRYGSTTGKVIAEVAEYLTPVVRVKDANQAIRFARKEDAEAFIRLFDRFLLAATATEHEWHSLRQRIKEADDAA